MKHTSAQFESSVQSGLQCAVTPSQSFGDEAHFCSV
ncbi:hypothetical protein M513_08938 [Trichuris suis]|uniref:Uncharacterized protein n=1 Tax=Trichuris suis TaxID=68888 RepID=A0A085LYZ7_9BILA|nr:hypothetical protein M513_08938 [Trichuris suis]